MDESGIGLGRERVAGRCGGAGARREVFGRALWLAGASAGVLGAACGQQRGEGPDGAGAPRAEPAKLLYIAASGAAKADLERKLFEDFNRSRPNGDVVVEVSPGPEGATGKRAKFVAAHIAGVPAALVENDWGGWMDMSEGGSIVELTPYFKRDRIDPKLFLEDMVNEYSDGGKLWALPVTMSVDALAYNMDLFDRAGLPYPPANPAERSWTMERFLEYAQRLTKLPDQVGFGGSISGGNIGGMTEGTHFGQGPWDDAKRVSLYNTPGMRKGFQFWLDVLTRHRVSPTTEEAAALRGTMTGNLFLTGKVGMQVFYSQVDRLPFRWGLATLPYSGPAGTKNISGRAYCHALHMGQIKERDAAWEVLKWLTRAENGGRFVVAAGHATSPIVKGGSDIAQQAYKDRTGVDARAYVLMAYNQVKPEAWGMFKYPNWAKVDAPLQELHRDMRAQKLGIDAFAEQASRLLNEQLPPPKR
jgi:multiple sugar transport system substrate-binding protein